MTSSGDSGFELVATLTAPISPARTQVPEHPPLRIGVVQHRWQSVASSLAAHLTVGVGLAAAQGARIVFLPELTLSRYPADVVPTGTAADAAEDLTSGPTFAFASHAARTHGVYVHASLYERLPDADDGLGYNTAIVVDPAGELVGRTRKLHIPVTDGYYENRYFRGGPARPGGDVFPVYEPAGLHGMRLGMPTCYDEWFPELARAYSLGGANVLVYATAIGSEVNFPGFDSQPMWQQVIVGNGIANGLFMIVPNRTGSETRPDGSPGNSFYGSSFVSDPYGRVLAQAPRDRDAVLVVDLDLAQREDWLALFPFLSNRRPDAYGALTK